MKNTGCLHRALAVFRLPNCQAPYTNSGTNSLGLDNCCSSVPPLIHQTTRATGEQTKHPAPASCSEPHHFQGWESDTHFIEAIAPPGHLHIIVVGSSKKFQRPPIGWFFVLSIGPQHFLGSLSFKVQTHSARTLVITSFTLALCTKPLSLAETSK